jgi:uncharacterized membrane protein
MWFWFALASAVLSAVSVTMNKWLLVSINPAVITWALFVMAIPVYASLLLWRGIPNFTIWSWIGAVGSAFVFSISKTLSLHVIKEHDLSEIYPLQTFSVLFSYIIALIFLSEQLSWLSLFGMLLVVIGAYVLNSGKANGDLWAPLKHLLTDDWSRMYLLATALTGVTATLDKTAITHTRNRDPVPTLMVECICISGAMTLYIITQNPQSFSQVKQHFGKLMLAGLVYTGYWSFFVGVLWVCFWSSSGFSDWYKKAASYFRAYA